jgi:hypothetical protein
MVMATQNPAFWSTSKAAQFLGLSEIRVRQFCKEGRLGTKVGNSYVITDEELREFAKNERPTGKPPKK